MIEEKYKFFEDEAHDRTVTVCAYYRDCIQEFICIGMSIRIPFDENDKELGRNIAKGRALKAFNELGHVGSRVLVSGDQKMQKVIDASYIDEFLLEDDFFLRQIAKTYFFDFKRNPERYITAYETE